MKNTTKKATVKFWEDLLFFPHFMQIFIFLSLPQISDYHHLLYIYFDKPQENEMK